MTKDEIKNLMLVADIPFEVIKPYVERVHNEFKTTRRFSDKETAGICDLARAIGITDKPLRDILMENADRVSLSVADKLAIHGDFTLNDITLDAIEWSRKNGYKWPRDYKPRSN